MTAQASASVATAAMTAALAATVRSAGRDQLSGLAISPLLLLVSRAAGHRRGQQRQRREREEPRDVEVEPVRQDELGADEERTGEGGELQRRLPPGHDGERERERDEAQLQHALRKAEVGEPVRVVLAPVPDRERGIAPDLPAERAIPEDAEGLERVRLEQHH